MPDRCYEISGVRVFECAAEGAPLKTGGDAIEIISAARSENASFVAIPAARLSEDFFRLKSGVAGEFVQKFVTYGVRLVVIGDVSRYVESSAAFRDFVFEANKGPHLWFVEDDVQLAAKLRRLLASSAE